MSIASNEVTVIGKQQRRPHWVDRLERVPMFALNPRGDLYTGIGVDLSHTPVSVLVAMVYHLHDVVGGYKVYLFIVWHERREVFAVVEPCRSFPGSILVSPPLAVVEYFDVLNTRPPACVLVDSRSSAQWITVKLWSLKRVLSTFVGDNVTQRFTPLAQRIAVLAIQILMIPRRDFLDVGL
jgi:hypothetical protein